MNLICNSSYSITNGYKLRDKKIQKWKKQCFLVAARVSQSPLHTKEEDLRQQTHPQVRNGYQQIKTHYKRLEYKQLQTRLLMSDKEEKKSIKKVEL